MINLKKLIINLLQGLFEYLLLFPIFLMIDVYIIPTHLLWIWLIIIPSLFFIGVLYRTIFSTQSWWGYAIFAMIIGILSSFIFEIHIIFQILIAIIHTVIVYRGMMYVGRSWGSLLPISFLWAGGSMIYFVSFFFFRYIDHLTPYLNIFTISGLLLICTTMFITNNDHLRYATLSKSKKPFISRNIRMQNRIFLIVTIGLILFISNGKVIKDTFWNVMRAIILWVLSPSDSPKEEIIEEQPPPTDMAPPFPIEDKGPSVIAKFLEMIVLYVMYIALALAAVFIILLFIKRTRNWLIKMFKKLIHFLKQIGSQFNKQEESVQYIDEKENIFDFKEWKEEQQNKVKDFMQNIFRREPSWESLSNQEKIRFIYRNLLIENITNEYHPSLTPREILDNIRSSIESEDEQLIRKLSNAYEKTRYGDKHIDDQTIREIYALIQK